MPLPQSYRFGSWRLDASDRLLYKDGKLVVLPPKVVDTLMVLVAGAGRVLTKEEMMKQLWPDTFVEEGTLTQYISLLRKSLGEGGEWIENLPRRGYRFTAPVEAQAAGVGELRIEEESRTRTVSLEEVIVNGPPGAAGLPGAGSARSRQSPSALPVLAGAMVVFAAVGAAFWLDSREYFWRSPIAGAQFQTMTDFDGIEEAATISRDGQFVVFLSDRDGQLDVWVTHIGSGEFHNLTKGSVKGLANRDLRNLGFSSDGSLVTFWVRRQGEPRGDIGIWAAPTLGGPPRPYLEGVAEYDWSPDGARLAFHTPDSGDPLFVSDGRPGSTANNIHTAPKGLHSHFPVWSPDMAFLYFVQGLLPDKLDIWRITPAGGGVERMTAHSGRVTHPVLIDRRTLLYLADGPDGAGPCLYAMDVDRRKPHRLTSDLERYTSLAASADGRRLVLTRASPKTTLWRLPITNPPAGLAAAARVSLTTRPGSSPRLGPNYLLYASSTGRTDSIWKLANGSSTELWRGPGARILAGPAISPDGSSIAFPVLVQGKTLLYIMRSDGTEARVVAGSLKLEGAPAWAPDGKSITTAAYDQGIPRLFRVPVDGSSPTLLVREYSVGAAWAPNGRFAVYSGLDIGATFPVRAVTAAGVRHPLPNLTLTRGARRLTFLPGGEALVYLRGGLRHKNLWAMDLKTGAESQLTDIPLNFDVRDFDISSDGHEVVLERVLERSNVVMLDLARP